MGRSSEALNLVFRPQLPARISRSPSPSRSTISIQFHQPLVLSRPLPDCSSRRCPLFIKTLMGVQWPKATRSMNPFPSRSAHTKSLILPSSPNSGAHRSVTSVKFPCPSFRKRYCFETSPNSVERLLEAIQISRCPSPSKSTAPTFEALTSIPSRPLGLLEYIPPLFS